MSDAVLSLGSNVGDRQALLTGAVDQLGDAVRAVSSVYSTPPWGGVPQADFLNIVVLVADEQLTDPHGWLDRCHELERAAGRTRDVRWGPRSLDADVIVVGQERRAGPELTIPHPHAHQRAFVLVPWAEVDPGAELPGHGPIADLIAGLDVAGIERLGRLP